MLFTNLQFTYKILVGIGTRDYAEKGNCLMHNHFFHSDFKC